MLRTEVCLLASCPVAKSALRLETVQYNLHSTALLFTPVCILKVHFFSLATGKLLKGLFMAAPLTGRTTTFYLNFYHVSFCNPCPALLMSQSANCLSAYFLCCLNQNVGALWNLHCWKELAEPLEAAPAAAAGLYYSSWCTATLFIRFV